MFIVRPILDFNLICGGVQIETMAEDMVVDTVMPRVLSAAQKGKGKVDVNSGRQVKGGPWVEKYRPTSLADVAAHKDIIDTSTLPLA